MDKGCIYLTPHMLYLTEAEFLREIGQLENSEGSKLQPEVKQLFRTPYKGGLVPCGGGNHLISEALTLAEESPQLPL
jgi:hypothetical protein